MPDHGHDWQLLRDLAIINARTAHELGALPPGGLPVQEKRKPNLPKPAPLAHPDIPISSSDAPPNHDGTHAMKAPPATQDEYWDRILELSRETDGKPSVDQIRDALGMTQEQLEEIERWVQQEFGGRDIDRVWAYEMLQSSIESWRGDQTGWSIEKYQTFGQRTEKSKAVSTAASKILRGMGKPSPDDLPAMQESYRKFAMLNKAFRPFMMTREEALQRAAAWESRHE